MRGDDVPSLDELAAEVADLRERLAALEDGPPARTETPLGVSQLVDALRDALPKDGRRVAAGVVLYAGVGPRGDDEVAWQLGRRWDDVLAADRARSARALAALASPGRLDIVAELLDGPLGRGELQARLDRSSAGQLNHHLRELLSAGLVEQPRRGVYQVPVAHVIPVLALLCCAVDLASDTAPYEKPTNPAG